jgi:drug/metabolite transporter (DMT)-like permease
MWAFLFAAERPSLFTLIGGGVILFAVLLQFYSLLFSNKKEKIIN